MSCLHSPIGFHDGRPGPSRHLAMAATLVAALSVFIGTGSGEKIIEDPGVVTVEASELADENNVTLGGAGVVEQD